jgi:hypothetical protein
MLGLLACFQREEPNCVGECEPYHKHSMLAAIVNQNQSRKDEIPCHMVRPTAVVLAKLMPNTPLLVHTHPVVINTMLARAPLATNKANPNREKKINFARVSITSIPALCNYRSI